MKNIKIEDVIIKDRHRKDMGDLSKLAKSIKEEGLINPITVTEDNRLIAGHRRVIAMSMNGENYVPAHVVSIVSDGDALKLEFDENEHRKEFTPSERVEMLKVITPPVGGDRKSKGSFEPLDKPREQRRDDIAKAVGFKNAQEAKRAKKISRDCIQEISDLVDIGKLAISTASVYISNLSEKEQFLVVDAIKKYGSKKWYYYEYQQSVINHLEDKKINRDQADGYAKAVKDGRRTKSQVTKELASLHKSITIAKAKASAKDREDREIKESKWSKVDISKYNLQESLYNVISEIGWDKIKEIKTAIDGAVRKHNKEAK